MPSEEGPPSKVLLVTVTNIKFPVNVDVLFTVFNKYGSVLRIVLFPRQLGMQALIEMETVDQAQLSIQNLNGNTIYSSSNLLKI